VPQIRPLADIVHFKYSHTYLLTYRNTVYNGRVNNMFTTNYTICFYAAQKHLLHNNDNKENKCNNTRQNEAQKLNKLTKLNSARHQLRRLIKNQRKRNKYKAKDSCETGKHIDQ